MKQIILLLTGMLMIAIPFNAQTLKGKVTDEKNASLAYANVVLQTADSIYVAGTTTDMEGRFELALHEKAKLINISFVGYSTITKEICEYDLGIIQLSPDTQLLGEVTERTSAQNTSKRRCHGDNRKWDRIGKGRNRRKPIGQNTECNRTRRCSNRIR